MALENLFIRTKKSIAGIELDAVLSEAHENKVTKTKNPIELGADVTDHSIIEPKRVVITAEVTDTPLGGAAFGELFNSANQFGSSTESNITRSKTAYNALVAVQDLREPIEIQTKLVLYQNMIIESITTVQDKDSSRIVSMIITAEELIITESEIVTLDRSKLGLGTTYGQAGSATNKGRQEPVIPTDSQQTSILKSLTDLVGVTQ